VNKELLHIGSGHIGLIEKLKDLAESGEIIIVDDKSVSIAPPTRPNLIHFPIIIKPQHPYFSSDSEDFCHYPSGQESRRARRRKERKRNKSKRKH